MQRKGNKVSRDPYYYWKVINMTLACVILILALLILFGDMDAVLVPLAFLLGAVMCAGSGIMELAKSKKAVGYLCSVFSGLLIVALLVLLIVKGIL